MAIGDMFGIRMCLMFELRLVSLKFLFIITLFWNYGYSQEADMFYTPLPSFVVGESFNYQIEDSKFIKHGSKIDVDQCNYYKIKMSVLGKSAAGTSIRFSIGDVVIPEKDFIGDIMLKYFDGITIELLLDEQGYYKCVNNEKAIKKLFKR